MPRKAKTRVPRDDGAARLSSMKFTPAISIEEFGIVVKSTNKGFEARWSATGKPVLNAYTHEPFVPASTEKAMKEKIEFAYAVGEILEVKTVNA